MMLHDGDLAIRPLCNRPVDYSILSGWLQNQRILEFFEGRDKKFTATSVQDRYSPDVMAVRFIIPCLIEFLNRPVGYIQYCLLQPDRLRELGYPTEQTVFSIDLFIGETDLWGCGLGRRAITCLSQHLFEQQCADRVIVDPQVDNQRAIHSYTAAGFHKVKLLPKYRMHEGGMVDCLLMEETREKRK